MPISIPESLVIALPPILSPSSRTFVELTPRQLAPTVGIAATGFCYPGGILQLFHRQDQQILRLPIAAARSHLANPSFLANFVINQSRIWPIDVLRLVSEKLSTSDTSSSRFSTSASGQRSGNQVHSSKKQGSSQQHDNPKKKKLHTCTSSNRIDQFDSIQESQSLPGTLLHVHHKKKEKIHQVASLHVRTLEIHEDSE
jgi:hypothetical protein